VEGPPDDSPVLVPVDPLEDPGWDEAVLSHQGASVFHSSAWARVLVKTYGHRPVYRRWGSIDRMRALVPLMEVSSRFTGRRAVCVPFADFCGPLLFSGADRTALDQELAAMAGERGWKYLELRSGPGGGLTGERADATFIAHQMKLHGSRQELEAGFSSAARRCVRQAGRKGVTVRVSDSWEAMEAFYRLHLRTRQRHGVPPQPLAFVRNIHRELLAKGHGFVVLGWHGGRAVAAAVFLHFGAAGLYKFGASERGSWPLRPNHPVMAEGIFALAERGVRHLHFGRTDPGQDGLRQFKRQWGAAETPLVYRKFESASGEWSSIQNLCTARSEWTHAACRQLPSAANRLLGRLLYSHLD
jgi:hypothetical protein